MLECFCVATTLDIAELNLPKTCQLEFPDPDDLLNFKLIICPDEVRLNFVLLRISGPLAQNFCHTQTFNEDCIEIFEHAQNCV